MSNVCFSSMRTIQFQSACEEFQHFEASTSVKSNVTAVVSSVGPLVAARNAAWCRDRASMAWSQASVTTALWRQMVAVRPF
eukprot:6393719-Amphidinium_carterae.1